MIVFSGVQAIRRYSQRFNGNPLLQARPSAVGGNSNFSTNKDPPTLNGPPHQSRVHRSIGGPSRGPISVSGRSSRFHLGASTYVGGVTLMSSMSAVDATTRISAGRSLKLKRQVEVGTGAPVFNPLHSTSRRADKVHFPATRRPLRQTTIHHDAGDPNIGVVSPLFQTRQSMMIANRASAQMPTAMSSMRSGQPVSPLLRLHHHQSGIPGANSGNLKGGMPRANLKLARLTHPTGEVPNVV